MIYILVIVTISYPIGSWQNDLLTELEVRGVHFTNTPGIRPYAAVRIDTLKADPLAGRLWRPNLSTDVKYDTVKVMRVKPAIFYDWQNFSLLLQPDVKFGNDSLPPSNKFMNLYSADYERVWFRYDHEYFGAFIGRERFSLGPSPRNNLLLSGLGPPADWFNYYLQTKYIKLSLYLSRLENMICKPVDYVGDTATQTIEASRYLSIKRLDVMPVRWLNISFSEAAVFGGEEDFPITFYYLNPLVLSHTYQYNWAEDANIFFHLDAQVSLKNKSFYGALLVDDFQIDPDPNNEPNHIGVNFGLEFADLLIDNTFVFMEYSAVSRYAYCHFYPYQRYEYRGYPLGSQYGPDYDELFFKCVYHLNVKFDLYAQAGMLRKGAVIIDSLWPIPDPKRVPGRNFPDNNFLSGTVQQSFGFGCGLKFFYKHFAVLDLFGGYDFNHNYHNLAGASKQNLAISIKIDCINLAKD